MIFVRFFQDEHRSTCFWYAKYTFIRCQAEFVIKKRDERDCNIDSQLAFNVLVISQVIFFVSEVIPI